MRTKGDFLSECAALGTTPERRIIEAVKATGSGKAAAKKLEISRSTVRHYLRKAGATVTQHQIVSIEYGKEPA